ncbi:zinc ABC transporter substrate-binding protein [Yoonia sediminilitoris]|uniref:High-affinity zinc uptake system protein ZnuA n=1 Tax=Yoonia sediminilitoris TaxID=1286148 RepID=A0A2T6KQC3_9RHOB|nr:zinc ABC transporter substrate-binding protein [Yoonia sediminilitoris]PUB18761.1 zinc transport system substrate-binding protein [Yoonia sediminilitoris]RCW98929.1 zinc transport system substrate-binding protein [Yoonia sediminilitoris]
MHRFAFLLAFWPAPLLADAPRVITDIAPIHSLAALVMGDLGTADLLLPPGADAHDFALRPSDAERLGDADLVIWVGPELTPWLADPIATLAPQATQLPLTASANWTPLTTHDGEIDPHGWLDPMIASGWVSDIATALAAADSENKAVYMANADKTVTMLTALNDDIQSRLRGLDQSGFIVPHDAYSYFESMNDLEHTASIADAHAHAPGPGHLSEMRDLVVSNDIVCVFSDAEIGARWVDVVIEGTDARTSVLNGTGAGFDAGPDLYEAMLRQMADAFAQCLGD